MIEKFGDDMYQLECDNCGHCTDETFDSFMEAVEFKKENNWKSIKTNGEWKELCPECAEK